MDRYPEIVNKRIGFFQNSNYPAGDRAAAIAFTRTYSQGKTRAAWGVPIEVALTEAKYAIPCIEAMKLVNVDEPFLVPYAKLNGHIYHRIKTIHNNKRDSYVPYHQVCTDFSAFDMCWNETFIKIFFEEFFRLFQINDRIPNYIERDMKAIIEFFINTTIVLPDSFAYQKKHGIPSGSYFTNIAGSFLNMTAMQISTQRIGLELDPLSMFLGDDSHLGIIDPHLRSFDDCMHALSEDLALMFGLILNPEKTKKGAYFLSRE
jgi:hypothetical protein